MGAPSPDPAPAAAPLQPPPAAPAAPRKRRRPIRFVLKLFAWTVAVLAGLLLVVFAFLQTDPGRNMVKSVVLDLLNSTFRGHFAFDSVGGMLPFDVELHGVRITDPDGMPVIQLATLRADFAPLNLFLSEVRLSNLAVEGPTVTFFDAQNRLALARAFEPRAAPTPTTAASPWVVRLSGIHLTRGALAQIVPGAANQDLGIDDLAADLSLTIGNGGLAWRRLLITAIPVGQSAIAQALRSPHAPLGAILIDSKGSFSGEEIRLDRLNVQAGPHSIAAQGLIQIVGLTERERAAYFSLDDLRIDADALQAFLPPALGLRGEVLGGGRFSVDRGRAVAQFDVDSPQGKVHLQADARLAKDPAHPARVALGAWQLSLALSGWAAPAALTTQLASGFEGLGLDVSISFAGSGLPLAPDAQLAGDILVQELGTNPAAPPGGRLQATIRRESPPAPPTSAFGFPALPGVPAPLPTFVANVHADAFDIARWAALAGQPALAGTVHGLDVDALVTLAPGTPALFRELSGQAVFDLDVDGQLAPSGQPLAASALTGTATFAWDGKGQPTGHVALAARDLVAFGMRAAAVTVDADALVPSETGVWHVRSDVAIADFVRSEAGLPGAPAALGALSVAHARVRIDATRGARAWLPSASIRVDLTHARRGDDHLGAAELLVEVRDSAPASNDADHGRASIHAVLRPSDLSLRTASGEVGVDAADLIIDAMADLAPTATAPQAPLGAVRGTVRGRIAGPRAGARQADAVDLDLAFDSAAALSAPWNVNGKATVQGVRTPEATATSVVVVVDVGLDARLQSLLARGTIGAAIAGLTLAALPGHHFEGGTVSAVIRADGKADLAAAFDESGRMTVRAHGTAVLPNPHVPFGVHLGDVTVEDLVRKMPVLVLTDASLGADGWITIGSLTLTDVRAAPGTTPGRIVLGGRIKPDAATGMLLQLAVHGERIDLTHWLDELHDLTGIAIPDLRVTGLIDLDLSVGGSLAAPSLNLTMELSEVRVAERGPFTGAFTVTLGAGGLAVDGAATWANHGATIVAAAPTVPGTSPRPGSPPKAKDKAHPTAPVATAKALDVPGKLDVHLDVPIALSLSPARVSWRPGSLEAHVHGANVDLTSTLELATALSTVVAPMLPNAPVQPATPHAPAPSNAPPTIASKAASQAAHPHGRITFDLDATGPSEDPQVTFGLRVQDFGLGKFAGGQLVVTASTKDNRTTASVDLFRAPTPARPAQAKAPAAPAAGVAAERDLVLHVTAELPHSVARFLRDANPGETLLGRIEAADSRFTVTVPRNTAIADLPLVDLLPRSFARARLGLELTAGGRLASPEITGALELDRLQVLPIDSATHLSITTENGEALVALRTTAQNGDTLIDGKVLVPRLAGLVRDPARAVHMLEDPRFRAEFMSADMASYDLWELSQSAGDSAALFFPDGHTMLSVAINGAPGGPVVDAAVRLRTAPSAQLLDAMRATVGSAVTTSQLIAQRNFASDVRVGVRIGPTKTELRAVLLQDGKLGGEHFSVIANAAIGTRVLFDGLPASFDAIPLDGTLSAEEFRLEGLAASLRQILGSTRGRINGSVALGGTFGRPTLLGGLDLYFEELAIAPLGFHRDEATAFIFFKPDSTLTVEGLEFADANDEGKPSRFALAFKAIIPALDPKQIRLEGRADFERVKILAKADMYGRADGFVTLGGTLFRPSVRGKLAVLDAVIAPKLGGRSVRPIGLPRDVRFVRGDPEPPADRVVARRYRVPIDLDVTVSIASGQVHIRPTIALSLGTEITANLVPHGELAIRTVGGEIGIFGTVYVPGETLEILSRTYAVDDDSRVVFTGDIDTDPQLYFAARRTIEDVNLDGLGLTVTRDSYVALRVTGSAREPIVKFTSNPAMDEQNIIAIIAFGAPSTNAPLSDVQGGVAKGVYGAFLSRLTGPLAAKLGLDVLRIDANSDFSSLHAVVGKYLAKDLMLSYEHIPGIGQEPNQEAGVLSYKLGDVFSVIVKASSKPEGTFEAAFHFHD